MPRLKRRIQWRQAALDDLRRIRAWATTIENANAGRTILRIEAAADSLVRLGDVGRPSRVEGLRELSVRRAPYVIVYRANETTFDILAVYHTKQQR